VIGRRREEIWERKDSLESSGNAKKEELVIFVLKSCALSFYKKS